MDLGLDVKRSIDKSVLCWLATSSKDNEPNVSPKEIFTYWQENIIIANIASPQSLKNIIENSKVSVSFIDILIQKGFQVKGQAEIIKPEHDIYSELEEILLEMTQGLFPFRTIFKIVPTAVKPIIAPRYILFPETTEEDQVQSARQTYKLE